MKYIACVKKMVLHCIQHGWLDRDPFAGFKMSLHEVERAVLTEEELKLITVKKFNIDRLSHVRDIFLFSCYTGLAYADVSKLKPSEISIGVDGQKWIFTHRQIGTAPGFSPVFRARRNGIMLWENEDEIQIPAVQALRSMECTQPFMP